VAKRKSSESDPLTPFHPAVQEWFRTSFDAPTAAQTLGWPVISSGEASLIFAPTGSGKTLTAFLWCINRLMFSPVPPQKERCRVLYISPLKALAVDVERNLRAPIAGISRVATTRGDQFHVPAVAIRTGDTPQDVRARFLRDPGDILITTPESLYLLLTSNARERLRSIETVIIDEIHALVPTKRGAHMALSMERLELLCERPPQRIGLSATQRPLDEVARFLGGCERRIVPATVASTAVATTESELEREVETEFESDEPVSFRPVSIVNTGEKKRLSLRVEVPVEDMTAIGETIEIPSGPAAQGVARTSIWPAIHPRLVELIRQHRSTLIFVNSRRLAERLAGALNELAGETIVNAHHGSISREQRVEIEDRLKSGLLPALIATSSLELGIDMGALDLVIQIEAPPSVASGMQRIGRASHHVGGESNGIIFPKFRGDLVACAAITDAMLRGEIESTRYPRNPLDIVAQQVVAMVAVDDWNADELFASIRQAAPFAELTRTVFDGVLDMLSGVYPSDEFAELRPRVTWDRLKNTLQARESAKRVAIINGGTIPDRGLYGVYLAGAEKGKARVGELDEEMVFESKSGETFVLGASTWRIEEITHDRVLVSPAPGQPGKMPFWKGDAAERPVQFGAQIGKLIRTLRASGREKALQRLGTDFGLDADASANLMQYIDDQIEAVNVIPDDKTIVIERCRDELGDWRVCVLSPFGGRVHAPWAMAAVAKIRNELGLDVESMWSDDGFVLRFPEADEVPPAGSVLPGSDEIESLVVRQLGSTSLFAAHFRENASRALLLPRRRPGQRAPLWQQRKRASDLLAVASRFGSFPIILETYRECLRDVFDLPALVDLIRRIEQRDIRAVTVDSDRPSPFASSLLFRYVANYIYDGDAPLAERRAQALSIDQSQLRELLGDAELRDLLDPDALTSVENELQHLDDRYKVKSEDGIHDLLLRIGDLSATELTARSSIDVTVPLQNLLRDRRVIDLPIAGERRLVAAEEAAKYRDALGTPLPTGIADRFLMEQPHAMRDLVSRYARTHAPFTSRDVAHRYAIGVQIVERELQQLAGSGRLMEGEFRPGGMHREWCDSEVLRMLRRRSLAKLRREVEPVEPDALVRMVTSWHGLTHRRRGLDALLEVIEQLQGAPLPASLLESDIFPARIENYRPSDLDTLAAAGEIIWTGVEPLGENDGRIAIYLTDALPLLHRAPALTELTEGETELVAFLQTNGASFFEAIHAASSNGFPNITVDLLWSLVWRGVVTNDTLHPLRSYVRRSSRESRGRRTPGRGFRSRRTAPPAAEGRWSLVSSVARRNASETERATALARQLLTRHGIVTRDTIANENVVGGFSAVYPVLRSMEDAGKIRRGFFVSGIAASQFALAAALDLLRAQRSEPEEPQTLLLAATDPANPFGSMLRWPGESTGSLTRSVGARVIIVNGRLAAYISRGTRQLRTFIPEEEPTRSLMLGAIASTLADLVQNGSRRALLLSEIDGGSANDHALTPLLVARGFVPTAMGLHLRSAATMIRRPARAQEVVEEELLDDDIDA
jgi:ATP-dependent Lhr-like helicase